MFTEFRKEDEIKEAIRVEIVKSPVISLRPLQRVLDEKGIHVGDLNYLSRLVKKVRGERLAVAHPKKLAMRMNERRQKHAVWTERLSKIAFWRPEYLTEGVMLPMPKDIIAALTSLWKMDESLFDAELAAGEFDKKLTDTMDAIRHAPISDQEANEIIAVYKKWGFKIPEPPKKIEEHGTATNTTSNGAGA